MGGEHLSIEGLPKLIGIAGQTDIVLLVDSLQFGMESTNHHILEAVGLDLRPVFHLVGRDILHITSHIVRGIGIRTFRADGGHELIVFVGNVIAGGQLTHAVNLVVGLTACLGVGQFAILLVAACDIVKIRLLSSRVGGTEQLGALEHQMLQIMGQTCCLGRVVARTSAHSYISLNAGLLVVHRQINLQSVVECVDAGLHHIARYSGVLVVFSPTADGKHHQEGQQEIKSLFHMVVLNMVLCQSFNSIGKDTNILRAKQIFIPFFENFGR